MTTQYQVISDWLCLTTLAFWFNLPADNGGIAEFSLNQFLLGFWLWLAAPGLIAIVSIISLLKQSAQLTTKSDQERSEQLEL